jgi:hypothetical protein
MIRTEQFSQAITNAAPAAKIKRRIDQVKKSFGIVAILVFVLSFGSLVFAQNSNSSTTTTTTTASTGKSKSKRKHRKVRRHRRSSKSKAKTGNANM